MSINPYYQYLLSISGQKEKETYYQRAWGKLNAMSRAVHRQNSRAHLPCNVDLRMSHNRLILSGF
ncbi:MAG TPA: hypothetical protein V6D17_22285, partial [Candidatus Obscuribacterales bacterium]